MKSEEFKQVREIAGRIELPDEVRGRVVEVIRSEEALGADCVGSCASAAEGVENEGVSGAVRDGNTWDVRSNRGPIQPTLREPRRANGQPRRKASKGAALAAVLCGAALVGTAAYAAIDTDFFSLLFSVQSREDNKGYEVVHTSIDGSDSWTGIVAGHIWYDADPEAAQRLVGDYVEEVNESITVGDYTLTLNDLVMDENDLGVATFTITSTSDLLLQADQYTGEVSFAYESDLRGIMLAWPEGGWSRSAMVLDESRTTLREAHLVVFFNADPDNIGVGQLSWGMSFVGSDESPQIVVDVPSKRVKTVKLTTPETECFISVSPFGYVVDTHGIDKSIDAYNVQRIGFRFSDGEERVGEDYGENIYNRYFGTQSSDDGSVESSPAFFIDTSQLESVVAKFKCMDANGNEWETGDIVFLPEE